MRARRGVALILVLWIVVLLAGVTAVASSAARSSGDVVAARRAQATGRAMAESGVTVAVTMIDSALHALVADSNARDVFLNSLDENSAAQLGLRSPLGAAAQDTVGDGAFAIAIVDVSARLDVNEAGAEGLARFLTAFVSTSEAQALANAVDARVRGTGAAQDAASVARRSRDSLAQALLGRSGDMPRALRPLNSVDELTSVDGFSYALASRLAPFLTVDGDSRINRRTAPREVIAAATGSLVDAPSRLLVISRGWRVGHPLSREIQAVYDVAPDGLHLVRWRERDL